MPTAPLLDVRPEAAAALAAGRPVVALESTLIAHGLPWPLNLETARAAEAAVRREGAVPATIAVWRGRPTVGLNDAELEHLARAPRTSARPAAAIWPPPWRRKRRPPRPSPPRCSWPTAPASASSPPAASGAFTHAADAAGRRSPTSPPT